MAGATEVVVVMTWWEFTMQWYGIHVLRCFVIGSLVSTPDGASELLEDVNSKVQHHNNSSLVQGTPVYGPRTLQKTMDKTR